MAAGHGRSGRPLHSLMAKPGDPWRGTGPAQPTTLAKLPGGGQARRTTLAGQWPGAANAWRATLAGRGSDRWGGTRMTWPWDDPGGVAGQARIEPPRLAKPGGRCWPSNRARPVRADDLRTTLAGQMPNKSWRKRSAGDRGRQLLAPGDKVRLG